MCACNRQPALRDRRCFVRPAPPIRRRCLVGWLSMALLAGCAGYQIGNDSLYPLDVQTVYVPVFESASFRRHLGEMLTEAVMKEIELKTPYKVVGTPNADSILTGRILSDTKHVVVEDRYDDPRAVEVALRVEVSWIDRRGNLIREGPAIPLPPAATVVGAQSTMVPEVGQSVATAQQDAIQKVAERIVGMMEMPW